MDRLLQTIHSQIEITGADRLLIEKLFQSKHYAKGEHLLIAGEVCRYIYFIESGLVRYYLHNGVKEQTYYFNKEGEFVCDYQSFVPQAFTSINIQALEDTQVCRVSAEGIREFYHEIAQGEKFGRIAIEQLFVNVLSQVISLYTDTPDQRYLKFLAAYPDLVQRIPQYYIASYVGVKPPSLSRIRRRLALK